MIRLFAKRDMALFPDDENGDILCRIWRMGGDLETARAVDFSMLFPTREQAESFARELEARGGEIEVSDYGDGQWDLRYSLTIVPSWKNISEIESWLAEAAEKYEGRNDGWGFFAG